jgi:hypothetical protein
MEKTIDIPRLETIQTASVANLCDHLQRLPETSMTNYIKTTSAPAAIEKFRRMRNLTKSPVLQQPKTRELLWPIVFVR